MKTKKMMEDLVASGLIGGPQEKVSPVPDPDNYVDVPLVTFYEMPEPPDLLRSLLEAENTSEDA